MDKQADSNDLYLANVKTYKSVFGSSQGQKVLWDMMKACDFTGDGFDRDSCVMAYNAGAKRMVSRIIKLLSMDEQKVHKYIEERKKADEYERYNING